MQYVTDLSKYQTENRTAVTLGKFDGLHRGHQELISRIQRFADQEKAESVVFAFDMGKEALMTGEEKKAYLEGCVDTLIICPFTEAIREMEAEEFIEKILIEQLHAAYIAVGTDFHFGHQKRGDICMLKQYAKRYGDCRKGSVSKKGNQQYLYQRGAESRQCGTCRKAFGIPIPYRGRCRAWTKARENAGISHFECRMEARKSSPPVWRICMQSKNGWNLVLRNRQSGDQTDGNGCKTDFDRGVCI